MNDHPVANPTEPPSKDIAESAAPSAVPPPVRPPRRWLVRLVLAAPILLIAIPVFVSGVPRQISLWHLAVALEKQARNDHRGALQALESALAWDSTNGDTWLTRAESYRAQGDFQAALADCTRARELVPEDLRYLSARIALNHLAGRHREAIQDSDEINAASRPLLDRVRDRSALASELANTAAYVRAVAGLELKEALAYAEESVRQLEGEPSMMVRLGYLKYLRRQFDEALHFLDVGIQLTEDDLAALQQLSNPRARESQIVLEQRLAMFHFYRSLVYEETNRHDAAAREWTEVRKLTGAPLTREQCPNYFIAVELVLRDAMVLDTLGYVRLRRGEPATALQDLELAVQQCEAAYEDWGTRYQDLDQQMQRDPLHGLPHEKLRDVERELKKSVAVIRYHRSLAHEQLNHPSQADSDRQRVRDLGFEPNENLF